MQTGAKIIIYLLVLFFVLRSIYLQEEYDDSMTYENNKFKIYFVPFSLNEPGWKETFQTYYDTRTRKILENVLKYLSRYSSLRFIWAETSFLASFWKEADERTKRQIKRFLENEQLEIVNGGWVVNDEASTHYFGILQQLIEGHLWLHETLGWKVRNGWAIGAVGHSPTMPFLLKEMGIQNLVINHVAYNTLRSMAHDKRCEFLWRQTWTDSNSTDLFTLVIPFLHNKSYCVFSQMDNCSHDLSITPEIIESGKEIENKLVEFQKYSLYFHSNMILVPLGARFSYVDADDTLEVFDRYFGFINYTRRHFAERVEARFSTLNEYFRDRFELFPRVCFNSASGDYFPYTDNTLDYWNGFYTSRPFYKRKDRILLSYLRAAEILFALAWSSKSNSAGGKWFISSESGFYSLLVEARRIVSLFQHHQAITGTSSTHVVLHYARKFNIAFKILKHIMQQSVYFLLYNHALHSYKPDITAVYFDVGRTIKKYFNGSTEEMSILYIHKDFKRLVLFNPLTWKRNEVVSFLVNSHNILVTCSNGTQISSQTSPVFSVAGLMIPSVYSISFVAQVEALSLNTYFMRLSHPNEENKLNKLSHVILYNSSSRMKISDGFEKIQRYEELKTFSISNHVMEANFNKFGLLQSVTLRESPKISIVVQINFVIYKTPESGAYIFKPKGAGKYAEIELPSVCVLHGPLYSQADMFGQVYGDEFFRHSVKMYHIGSEISFGLVVRNFVDVQRGSKEIAMRISSGVVNGRIFYTDLNGLQMTRRERNDWGVIARNYYPMSAAAYIQDEIRRLTVVSGQPGGVTSPDCGKLELMLDRRSLSDDKKGLGEGIRDNRPYIHASILILETRTKNCYHSRESSLSGSLSLLATVLSHSILNPFMKHTFVRGEDTRLKTMFQGMAHELERDFHLVKMHTFHRHAMSKVGVILHRLNINKCFRLTNTSTYSLSQGNINVSSIFPLNFNDTIVPASLSFLNEEQKVLRNGMDYFSAMDMKAYVMS